MKSDLIFLHCGTNPQCSARVDKRFADYFTLQLMTAGAVELFYDETRHEMGCEGGHHWFWPAFPGPRIRFHLSRHCAAWHHRYAAFSGPRVEHWRAVGLWPNGPQIAPRPPENQARFDEILFHIQRGGEWAVRRAIGELENLLLELAEARAQTAREAAWLQKTRDWIEKSPDFAPNYTLLARELGIGLSTLRRHFKAATGQSLHAYALQLRLADARRLLGETDLPLKAVAQRLGYNDVFFFSAQFKKLAGVAPMAYRKSRQE